jgi:FkbM family methyltransferase
MTPMRIQEAASLAVQAMRPQGLDYARRVRSFTRRHELPGPFHRHLRTFPHAERFGLTILPPLRLDRGFVVDVGANVGAFVDTVLHTDPRVRVLAIEPGEAVEELRAKFAADRRVTVDSRAVSASAGTAELFETSASVFSSLHPPLEDLAVRYGDAATVKKSSTVETATLDEIVGDRPVSILKVDVQGAERELISGAGRTLSRASAVLIEVNFIQHYEAEAGFQDLHGLMAEHGLALYGFGRMHRQDRGPLLWADACYAPLRPPNSGL